MEGDKEADLQKAIGLAKAFSEVFGLELIVRRLTEIGDSVDEIFRELDAIGGRLWIYREDWRTLDEYGNSKYEEWWLARVDVAKPEDNRPEFSGEGPSPMTALANMASKISGAPWRQTK